MIKYHIEFLQLISTIEFVQLISPIAFLELLSAVELYIPKI